jgi:hypothetical protein
MGILNFISSLNPFSSTRRRKKITRKQKRKTRRNKRRSMRGG